MPSIPASHFVTINPSTIGNGGTAQDLVGFALTENSRMINGSVLQFLSWEAVSTYFGPSSIEAQFAAFYFNGFTGRNKSPKFLNFYAYTPEPTAAFLRGGTVPSTIAQLQAITSGSLSVNVDGTVETNGSAISLAGLNSYSAIAAHIGGSIGVPNFTFDSISQSFVLTSGTTGTTTSSIAFATGSMATALGLTQQTGAVISPASDAMTPSATMQAITKLTKNWATFSSIFAATESDMEGFSTWVQSTNYGYAYFPWDTDITAGESSNSPFGLALINNTWSGVAPCNAMELSAMIMGSIASIDFTQEDGRTSLAYRSQSGMTPTCTDEDIANYLEANGYNYYADADTANEEFDFVYPGQISGPYKWIDSYVNQIWLSNQLQLALMIMLTTYKSIPYNDPGYEIVHASCLDPITAAVNFGAIRAGVSLSAAEAQQVNEAAGVAIDATLTSRGWYLQVLDASTQTRTVRQSPPITLWYMDGQSIQSINVGSVSVQ